MGGFGLIESVAGIAVPEGAVAVGDVTSLRAACSAAGGYVTGLGVSVTVLLAAREPGGADDTVSVGDFNLPLRESFE